jgi:hypothetical protein
MHAPGGHQGRPPFNPDGVPAELRRLPQWVAWRYGQARPGGKRAKVPIDAKTGGKANITDRRYWSPFEAALEARDRRGLDGLGFALAECGGIVIADLDGVYDPQAGGVVGWAAGIVREFGSYTEVSPSGDGLHLIAFADLPANLKRKPVELYVRTRYVTITGRLLPGSPPEVREASAAVADLYRRLTAPSPGAGPAREGPGAASACPLPDDDELIRLAMRARNAAKFRRLWRGEWEGDYPSQSEADLALCSILAFYAGPFTDRIDRLFRRSGLMRDKWRRADYHSRTIGKALGRVKLFYSSPPLGPTLHATVSVPSKGGPPQSPPCVYCESQQTYPPGNVDEGLLAADLEGLARAAFRVWPLGNPADREDGDLLRLSLLCEGMAAARGGPFFLSSRTAARLLRMSQRTAVRRLARLVKAGELVLMQRGKKATGMASVYCYTGPSFFNGPPTGIGTCPISRLAALSPEGACTQPPSPCPK